MCVIFIVEEEKGRPTSKEIDLAFDQNNKGGGAAWRALDEKKEMVHWEKGCDRKRMQELNTALPIPYILHFRKPTCGQELPSECHPFPISPDSPVWLKGQTAGEVLFHNGTWKDWEDTFLDWANKGDWKLPDGPYIDSRCIAIAAGNRGVGILEFIKDKSGGRIKVVRFGPDTLECYGPVGGWTFYDSRFIVSNTLWCKPESYYTTPPASVAAKTLGPAGGGPKGNPFHPAIISKEEEILLELPYLALIQMRADRKLTKSVFKKLKRAWPIKRAMMDAEMAATQPLLSQFRLTR